MNDSNTNSTSNSKKSKDENPNLIALREGLRKDVLNNEKPLIIGEQLKQCVKELQQREKKKITPNASPYIAMVRDFWDTYDLERAILGAFIREGLTHITPEIRAKHFTKPHHRVIAFQLKQSTNIVDLSDALEAEGKLHFIGGRAYLVGLLMDWRIFKSSSNHLCIRLNKPDFARQFVQGLLDELAKRYWHEEEKKKKPLAVQDTSGEKTIK